MKRKLSMLVSSIFGLAGLILAFTAGAPNAAHAAPLYAECQPREGAGYFVTKVWMEGDDTFAEFKFVDPDTGNTVCTGLVGICLEPLNPNPPQVDDEYKYIVAEDKLVPTRNTPKNRQPVRPFWPKPPPTPTPSVTPTPTNTPTPTLTPTPVPECQVLNDPVYDKENDLVILSGQGTPGWPFEIWRDYKGEQVLIAQGTIGEDGSFDGIDNEPPPGLVFYFATVGGNESEACRKSIELPAPTDFEATMVCTNPWDIGITGRVTDQWEDTYPKLVPMLFKLVPRDEVKNLTVSGTFETGFEDVRQYIGQEGNEIEIALTVEGFKAKAFDITQAMFDPCPLPTPTPEPTDTPVPTKTPTPKPGWGADENTKISDRERQAIDAKYAEVAGPGLKVIGYALGAFALATIGGGLIVRQRQKRK